MEIRSIFTKLRLKKYVLKPMLKLYIAFGASLLVFLVAFQSPLGERILVEPFTSLVAMSAGLVMNLFGASSNVFGNTLATAAYSINVVDGCNGIYATAILISGVIAFPSRLKDKLWGVVLGTLAVFVLNLGRVISLFYLGQYQPDFFQEVHVYVWQPIIIVWAIFVWDFWSRRIGQTVRPV